MRDRNVAEEGMAAFAVVASFALVTFLGGLVAWLVLRNRRPKGGAGPTATFPELCAALGAVPEATDLPCG
jgi:hypothetical protein